jgi:DNA-binding MarR family transcriptional regulator
MLESEPKADPRRARGPTGAIRRAYLALQRCGDVIFRPRRVTFDQFSLLWAVDMNDGLRQNELAEALFTDANTVTAMLARLEKRGLVRREVCEKDGRARKVRLTASGRRLTRRLSDDWQPMRDKLQEAFAGEAGQEAFRVLDQVRELMMQSRLDLLEEQKTGTRRAGREAPSRPAAPQPKSA